MGRNVPIYGMNRGSVGFLMNEFRETGLRKRLAAGAKLDHPSVAHDRRRTCSGEKADAHAINEVSLLRQTSQAAKLRVFVDGQVAARRTDCRRRVGRLARGLHRL